MNFKKKIAAIVASGVVAIGGAGVGFGAWQFSQDASSTHKHDVNVGDFIFNTIQISESSESISGTLSKSLTTTHNIRCDGLDQGYQGQLIDLNDYITVTPLEGATTTNDVIFQVDDGDAEISGSTLTTTGDSSSITVRAYEDDYPDNYILLAFKNTTSENKAAHQGVRTYGNIAWNNWSSYTSTSSTHTRTRTGTLSYTEKCSVCDSNLGSGSITINSSNYDDYATYDATGLGTTQTGSHDMVRSYGTISWGSWSGYSQYGTSQHKRTRTGTLSYTESCSDCGRSGNSGSITINSSNYSTYAQYNTSSSTYQEIESCNDDKSSYVSSSTSSTYWGSWTDSGSEYSEVTREPTCTSTGTRTTYQDQTRSGYYYRYASGYNYYCDCCNRFMRSTGQGSTRVDTSDSRTLTVGSSTISATGHSYGSSSDKEEYTSMGSSGHQIDHYQICKNCGYEHYTYTSTDGHTWGERHYGSYTQIYCTYCGYVKS